MDIAPDDLPAEREPDALTDIALSLLMARAALDQAGAAVDAAARRLRGGVDQVRQAEHLRAALDNINRRASPGPDRSFDDCSRDLYWCACEARRALG